jgi:hypothetical protein
LDAKHSDINTSTVFAETVFEKWQVDACTLSPYAGLDMAAPFLVYPGKAVFVECYTGNPSAAVLQEYPSIGRPFYLHLVKEAKNWGTPEQLGPRSKRGHTRNFRSHPHRRPRTSHLTGRMVRRPKLRANFSGWLKRLWETGYSFQFLPNLLTTEHPAEAVNPYATR